MSTTRKSVVPKAHRHLWIFLVGAGLSLPLARLAGTLLEHELQPLRLAFVPLSALAGGLAAVAGMAGDAAHKRRQWIALAALALGLILLLGLYLRFTTRVTYRGGSIAFFKGLSRSGHCDCNPDDNLCIQEMGLDSGLIHACWNGVWAVELALALCYLLTLGSLGTVAGLILIPARPQAPGTPEAPPGYLDFDLWIDQKSEGLYRAKAWSGAAGFEAMGFFSLPAALAGGELGRAGGGALRGGPATGVEGAGPEQAGGELFRAVFQGEVQKAFQGCLAKARGGPGLRIRLRLNDVPQLAGLPWEYLYDAAGQGFLALSARTPVVRYLELSEPLGTLLVEPPLRVLAVISTPRSYTDLAEADEEWRRLGAAMAPLRASGLIEVERLERPTAAALQERLRSGKPVHIFHFIGHGGFSELRDEGVLVFEDEDGNGVPVGAPSLAYLFQGHPSLRLAVLNACDGARGSQEKTFAGTAQLLVQRGVPAVIAMRSEVMDDTACSFADKLYRAVAAGLPVDACISEVRQALAREHNPEWGTPVLYLRATDGRLFEGLNPAHRPGI